MPTRRLTLIRRSDVRRKLGRAGLATGLTALLVAGGAITAHAATLGTGPSVTGLTGVRSGATRLSFPITDQVSASVDIGTGNLNVAATLLRLPGVQSSVPVGISYNSRDTTAVSGPTSSTKGPAKGWTWSLAGAGTLSLAPNGSTIVYTTADGATWPFTQSGGVYTPPIGLKARLVKNGDGTYTLAFSQSMTIVNFDSFGNATSVGDRNSNSSTVSTWASNSLSVVGTAGATAARTATLSFAPFTSGGYTYYATSVSQSNGSAQRSSSITQTSAGLPTAFTDATGAGTGFVYNSAGLVSQITNPLGATTTITYDSSNRVTKVERSNTTSGSAGLSTTRLTYPSSTSTLVADPNTSLSSSVSSVPHATYTLDGNDLVTNTLDAAGRTRSATFTPQGLDTASSTTGAGTAGGSSLASVSTTYGYDTATNNGFSLTDGTGQSGNKSTAQYSSSSNSTTTPVTPKQFLPSSTVTDANVAGSSNTTSYGYNTAGNMTSVTSNTTSGTTGGATSVASNVTRNGYGQVTTATAPGNSGNPTTYTYDSATHLLQSVTPVTGSSLGSKTYTYDAFARLKTQTDGAGNTTTYTYDKVDRLLTTSFSDSTGTVTNTWDSVGDLVQQVSDGGTVTRSYDQLGQLLSTANSAFGGTISYTYDAAGHNTSISDSRGTTTQAFDAAGGLLSTTYPKGSGTATTQFDTDDNGNRTDEWLQSNAAHTAWAAHVKRTFDASGRVSHVFAEKGPASGPTTQMDVYYCYNSAGSGTSCGSAQSADYSKLQWTYNALTAQTTKFTYDGMGRLQKVLESGGNNGNSTYTYTYDARGNRLTATVTGSTTSSQTLTYNAANQITTSGYTYDGAGNMTASPNATYSYNAAEQMTKAVVGGVTSTYSYAGSAQNQVLSESVGGGSTYHIAYGRGGAIAQYQVGANTAYVEQDPVSNQATMLHTSSDIAALYVYDGLGSPVALLTDFSSTSFQYKYDPYGLPTLQSSSGGNGVGQNPYGFKSGVQDRATGFVKFGQRWYNLTTGSWTQRDTLDSPLDPTSANRYAYAGDDPVNNSDPNGAKSVLGAALDLAELLDNYGGVFGLLNDASNSDITAFRNDLLTLETGELTAGACEAVLAIGAIPTLGIDEIAGQAVCAGASLAISTLYGNYLDSIS